MDNWTTTLVVSDLYDAYDAGHLTPHELATHVSARLAKNPFAVDPELQRVIAELEQVGDHIEFNTAMEHLCDYADIDSRILVERDSFDEN